MYQIRAIKYGSQYYPGPAIFYFSRWFEWVYIDFYFWLLQSDRHTILIDTGMDQAYADKANPHIVRALGDEKGVIHITIDPLAALAEHGVEPENIDYVILSHMHLDHIACVPRLPRAIFVTSRSGLEWTLDPPYEQLVNPIFMPREVLEFLREEAANGGRVILTEDDAAPLPGIRSVRTGGHSYCSQIIFVETAKGTVGFGADNVIMYENYEERIPAGSPVNVLDAYRALDLLAAESDIVVPGHDPRVDEIHPNGMIA